MPRMCSKAQTSHAHAHQLFCTFHFKDEIKHLILFFFFLLFSGIASSGVRQNTVLHKWGDWFFKCSSRQWEMVGWISPGWVRNWVYIFAFETLEWKTKLLVDPTGLDLKLMEQRQQSSVYIQSGQNHSSDNLSVSSSYVDTPLVDTPHCHIHPEAPSSPCKCISHRVTDFKPVTKWLKLCHHNASYLGAQILCCILFMNCLNIKSALLHFQQICVRITF